MFLSWKLCWVLLTLQETTGGRGQEQSASRSIVFCEYCISRFIKRTLNFWQTVLKLAISYWTEWKMGHHHPCLFGEQSRCACAGRATLILPCIAFPEEQELGKSLSHVWVQPHICITSLSKSCCCSVNGEQTGMFQDIFVASWSKLVCIFEVSSKMIEE